MIVLDVAEDQVDSLVAGAGGARPARSSPSPFRRGTMACTGIEFCKLAIVETKARGASLIDELERRLPDFDEPHHHQHQRLPQLLRPHPGRRHRPQGPAGHRTRRATRSRATRCTWAAPSAWTPGFGRKVRGLKVTADELPDYVERVLARFQAEREDGERFAQWVARAERGGAVMSERRATRPFYCPYCGDEDLRPYRGGRHGAWECAPATARSS